MNIRYGVNWNIHEEGTIPLILEKDIRCWKLEYQKKFFPMKTTKGKKEVSIKRMREIRDKLSQEIMDMSYE